MKVFSALTFAVLFALAPPAVAQQATAPPPAADKPLRVGIFENPPYVQRSIDGEWAGMAVDMWLAIAKKLGVKYEFVEVKSAEVFDELERGALDVMIGEVTLRADRERRADFSHPYFGADLGMASLPGKWSPDWVAILRGVFNSSMMTVMAFVVVLLLAVSVFLWMVENRGHIKFNKEKRTQFGDMCWFALATLTTVGSSERGPRTGWGRWVGAAWMLVSVLLVASFTASVASSVAAASVLAYSNLRGDLYGKRIAVVSGSMGESYFEGLGIHPIAVPDIRAGLELVRDEKVDLLAGDLLGISYLAQYDFPGKFTVTRYGWLQEAIAFAFPNGSPLVKDLNIALLEITESDEWNRNVDEWIGDLPGVDSGMSRRR